MISSHFFCRFIFRDNVNDKLTLKNNQINWGTAVFLSFLVFVFSSFSNILSIGINKSRILVKSTFKTMRAED